MHRETRDYKPWPTETHIQTLLCPSATIYSSRRTERKCFYSTTINEYASELWSVEVLERLSSAQPCFITFYFQHLLFITTVEIVTDLDLQIKVWAHTTWIKTVFICWNSSDNEKRFGVTAEASKQPRATSLMPARFQSSTEWDVFKYRPPLSQRGFIYIFHECHKIVITRAQSGEES